jgi:putative endonuclease
MFWEYMLQCNDGSYYIGHADELKKRIAQHHTGCFADCYTASRRPICLMYSQDFSNRENALAMERKIKSWR